MKRTPIARKTRLRSGSKAELKRTSDIRRSSRLRAPGTPARTDRGWNSTLPVSRKPMKQTRHRKAFRHLRDEPYKAWVRGEGCILRGKPGHTCKGPVEFAHLHNEGNGGADRGNGVGLCRDAGHRFGAKSHHVMGKVSFPAYWGVDLEGTARALLARYLEETEWAA